MKPGEVSQPIRDAKGYQIFKLEKMTTPVAQPFESVRDMVAEKVYGEPPAGGGPEVPRPPAQPGDHRVEERRAEEGLRDAAAARTGRPRRPASETGYPLMKIGAIDLSPPFALAPMAGMTDTAFRRLVKRRGGCGLVVSEMVSSEGLVRGIDRTLEYAEYTEEERPVSIQIFGGDPEKMAAAAQIVEGMGADIVDVNMGCPVPKIAKHNAGCSLMREPEHAASLVRAMARAVKIPGDGEDARRLGRRRRSTRRTWRGGWKMPAPPR